MNIAEIRKNPQVEARRIASVREASRKPKSEETRRKMSEAQKGKPRKPLTPEQNAKRILALRLALCGKKRPPHVLAALQKANIGKKRPEAFKNLHGMTTNDLTPEQNEIRLKHVSESLIGHAGFGKCKRGIPDHAMANWFKVRNCATGEIYEFSNLSEWARKNEWLFYDDYPHSRSPFWKRIAAGISKLAALNGEQASSRGFELLEWKDLRGTRIVLPSLPNASGQTPAAERTE